MSHGHESHEEQALAAIILELITVIQVEVESAHRAHMDAHQAHLDHKEDVVLFKKILAQLTPLPIPEVKSADIEQIGEKVMANAITPGVQVGKTGTFQIGNLLPAGSSFAAGTTFTYAVDDTANASIVSNPDGTGTLTVNQTAPVGSAATVSATGANADGSPFTTTLNPLSVPYLSDVVVVPTSADVQQIA